MLCASGVSVNFSELGLGSLWGLWDWSHGVDMATASLEPLQVLPALWDQQHRALSYSPMGVP